uniref:Uncharacterized protein DDB_G0286591 n=1 Tax=Drosophila rhopaloa TaxID=1041015 RepID=A0A6P4FL79_DRORH
MDLLSKPISEITPVAPIVCINDPDKIEEQIKLDICDGNECKLLRSDIEIMKADYDNWDHIFKDMRMKVNFEIIIWERAYKVVCELLEENKVEANVIKGEHVQYVRLTHKPIESVCIKEDTRKGFTSFTLPQASTWIQKKILDLKISLGKVENDQQFINAQRERITSIESCLTERENLLAQNSIVFEKLKEIEANLDKEPHAISVGQQDWDKEFREFMSEVEKDNAVLSQMTDDILLLSNKLSALRSENLTDSIVNGVRKEINQLLLRLGGNTPAKAAYAPKTPIKVLSNNNNSNKNDSGENDSIKIDSTKINLAITHSKKNNSKHIDLAQNSSTTNNTNKLGSENTLIKKYFTKIHSTVESTENDLNKINSTRSDTTKIEKSENNIIQVDSIETKLKKSDSSKNDSIKFESFKNLKKKKTTQYATKIDSTENDPNEIGSTENDSIKIDLGKNMLKANSEENNSDKKTSTGKNLYKVDFPKNDLTDDDLNNSVLTKQKSIKIMSIEKDLSSINSGESYSIKINTGENVIKLNSEENSSNTNNSSESKFDKVVSAENTLSDDDLFEIDLTKQESIQNESVEKDLSCIDSPENNFINIKTTEKRYIKNDSTAKDFINIDSTKYYSFEIDSPKNDWERKPDQHDTADTKTIQDEKFSEKNIKQNQNDFYQEECKTKCEDETNNYLQGKYKSNRPIVKKMNPINIIVRRNAYQAVQIIQTMAAVIRL